jgi:hypothetical protein
LYSRVKSDSELSLSRVELKPCTCSKFNPTVLRELLNAKLDGTEYRASDSIKGEETKKQKELRETVDRIISTWNKKVKETALPQVKKSTKDLTDKIKARLKNFDEKEFGLSFDKVVKNNYLHGANWFKLAWMVKDDTNFEKVIDGWMDWKNKDEKHNEKDVDGEMSRMEQMMEES